MNLTIERADLARMLTAVSRAVERRNTIPILSHVLLTAADGYLSAKGTDLDVEAVAIADANITTPGAVAVDAVRLTDIAKKMVGAEVTLTLSDDKLTVRAGRSRFALATLPAGDFPTLTAKDDWTAEFDLDIAAFTAPVNFAQSEEEARYFLNGTYLHTLDGNLIAVATDGHRLAKNSIPAPDGVSLLPGVIVPRKAVALLPKGEVHVQISQSKIRLSTKDGAITSKLVEGTFPDYARVVPTGNNIMVSVGRDDFIKAVARATSVGDSKRASPLKVSIASGGITLSMRGDGGEANEELPIEFTGEPFEFGVNGRYVGDVLGAFTGKDVEFAFADAGAPILVRGQGMDLAVIMPMRV